MTTDLMNKPIVNTEDLPWQESNVKGFEYKRKSLSNHAGSNKIGVSMYELAPGKKAFPFHAHTSNEEAILILHGKGTLRYSDQEYLVKTNDYIAISSGRAHAHQLINTSAEKLTYICISTMHYPDVMFYPDSNKIGVMTGSAPGGVKTEDSYKDFFYQNTSVDYYDGEID